MSKLFDLVEGKWNQSLQAFVKTATHKTNVPYAICKDEQKKREGGGTATRANSVRFKIVPNGELQYSNTFIINKKEIKRGPCENMILSDSESHISH